ncbi:hypothetical protein GGR54DRAFT_165474 [Hypoxylon sp. NC1633]|nr:hypothetical protein GGR54DRAFT_165474 [Hypoxylon sp. NC1633]
MYGKGNLNDAKALQAEFSRPKSRNRGGTRGGGGYRGGEPRRGSPRGTYQGQNGRPDSRRGPVYPPTPSQNYVFPPPPREPAYPSRPGQNYMQSPPPQQARREQTEASASSGHRDPRPPSNFLSGEESHNAAKRARAEQFAAENRNPFQQSAHQQAQDANLMDFDKPMPGSRPTTSANPFQNSRQHGRSRGGGSTSSIMDSEDGNRISQPVMQFTPHNQRQQEQDQDVTMKDASSETSNGNPPVPRGLAASRWNPENPQSYPQSRSSSGDPMVVDPPSRSSSRPPTAKTGDTIVQSGMTRGIGLGGSRWA